MDYLENHRSVACRTAVTAAALLAGAGMLHAQTTNVERLVDEQAQADAEARRSQERIEELDDETGRMLAEYRQLVTETERLETYNEQLAAQVQSQQEEIDDMLRQLDEIDTTSSEVMPMMQRMLETLEEFVALDMPFLPDERDARIDNLKDIMRRADVSVSEKYRRIVEAYGVEMEYGRTIESYRGEIGDGDERRTVDFLRVGRAALLYQTLDGRETGFWHSGRGEWIVDDAYRAAARDGLRIAAQQAAPDLMILPVPSPAESRP